MANQSCVCVTSTCPPCMGRCGCKFQKAESGLAEFMLGAIFVASLLALLVFARKLLRRPPRAA